MPLWTLGPICRLPYAGVSIEMQICSWHGMLNFIPAGKVPYGRTSQLDPKHVAHVGCTLPCASTQAMTAESMHGDSAEHRPGSDMLHSPTVSPGSTLKKCDVTLRKTPLFVLVRNRRRSPDIAGLTLKSVNVATALVSDTMMCLPPNGSWETLHIESCSSPGTLGLPAPVASPPSVSS